MSRMLAQRIAARAVQSLADSEPNGDTIEAQDRLKGTPQESLFCVSAAELEAVIAVTISNAMYDGDIADAAALLAARRENETTTALLRDVVDAYDWWQVDPVDREAPAEAIAAARAALAATPEPR